MQVGRKGTSLGDADVGMGENELPRGRVQCETVGAVAQGQDQHACRTVQRIGSCDLVSAQLQSGFVPCPLPSPPRSFKRCPRILKRHVVQIATTRPPTSLVVIRAAIHVGGGEDKTRGKSTWNVKQGATGNQADYRNWTEINARSQSLQAVGHDTQHGRTDMQHPAWKA